MGSRLNRRIERLETAAGFAGAPSDDEYREAAERQHARTRAEIDTWLRGICKRNGWPPITFGGILLPNEPKALPFENSEALREQDEQVVARWEKAHRVSEAVQAGHEGDKEGLEAKLTVIAKRYVENGYIPAVPTDDPVLVILGYHAQQLRKMGDSGQE